VARFCCIANSQSQDGPGVGHQGARHESLALRAPDLGREGLEERVSPPMVNVRRTPV